MKALNISQLCLVSVLILALMVAWVAATPQRSLTNNVVGGACDQDCESGGNFYCDDVDHGGYSWCDHELSLGMCSYKPGEPTGKSCVPIGYYCHGGGGCEQMPFVHCR